MRLRFILFAIPAVVAAAPTAVSAQMPRSARDQVTGTWLGALPLEIPFRILVRVRTTDSSLAGTIDFPDQNANGLPLSELRTLGDTVHFRLAQAGILFAGVLAPSGDSVVGVFSQGDQRLRLVLRRPTAAQLQALERPQTPRPPFPYREEDVRINADSGIVLAGTLVIPHGGEPRPAVLLLPGAGFLDRDAPVGGHRPFQVLADELARRGFVVLRYAKRGVPPSTGDFVAATTADLANDAAAAIRLLRARQEVDARRVTLFGHSEGALVAAMVASRDSLIAGTVLFGAPGMRGDSLMISRASDLLRRRGVPEQALRKDAALRSALVQAIITPGSASVVRLRVDSLLAREFAGIDAADLAVLGYDRASWTSGALVYLDQLPWFRYWLPLDPTALYGRMHSPVLALFGGLDWQVPPTNADRLRAALAPRASWSRVEVLPGINHQMQTASTGSPEEYGTIAETIARVVLDRIAEWLQVAVR